METSEIKIEDTVRSYDFEGRKDCYVEGVVIGFVEREGCNRYVIRVERDVVRGLEQRFEGTRVGTNVYPPVNGTRKFFGGVCNAVEKIA